MDEYRHIAAGADFAERAHRALNSPTLQSAIEKARPLFVKKRSKAVAMVPNFAAMRARARAVREYSLDNLPTLLREFERSVNAAGGQVHWAETPADARRIVLNLCREAGARTVTKGKSMVGEELRLNEALIEAGIQPHETDLGEYILQLAEQPPSHIIAPAMHLTKQQVVELFQRAHELGPRELESIKSIVDEARAVIRDRYLAADVGITGANALIASTGTAMLVTNEGNGDLTASLPKTHIVTASLEKVVRNWDDASAVCRVLARSATGQPISVYTSFYSAARGADDHDRNTAFHVVLLDNKRSQLVSGKYREMLLCIRCGACMNHCPVYQSVGGHAYHSVYPGPMGAVLTPLLRGAEGDYDLPNASSFCGRCENVCPVQIPLPKLLRQLREDQHSERADPRLTAWLVRLFMLLARYPRLYRHVTGLGVSLLALLSRSRGKLRRVPLAGAWTGVRDLPAPEGQTFQAQWRRLRK